MKQFKKTILIVSFMTISYFASGQSLYDIHAGLYTAFLSSNTLISKPGFGLAFGAHTQAMVNRRLDFFTEDYLYIGGLNIEGFNYIYSPGNPNPATAVTNNNFIRAGLNYSIGLDYYPIRDKFSIGAGIFVSVNEMINFGDDNAPLGTAPADPNDPVLRAQDLDGFKYDYGLHFGIRYRLPHVQFSLAYFNGFNNIVSNNSGPNISATVNDVMLSVHFFLREFSVSKPYENKLLK